MPKSGSNRLSTHKASEMLRHGKVRGHKLTGKQKKYMRAVAHGWTPTRMK